MNTKLLLEDLPRNKIRWVDLSDFENLCFGFAKAHLDFTDQPIPDFVTRNPGVLESCLETPFQNFGGIDPHPRLIDKLSLLFYLLVKNHPFRNGNKRIAVMTLFVILFLNGLWLKTSELSPYKLAISVAISKREGKDKVIKQISSFISKYCTEV